MTDPPPRPPISGVPHRDIGLIDGGYVVCPHCLRTLTAEQYVTNDCVPEEAP